MQSLNLSQFHPVAKWIFAICCMFVCYIVFTLLGLLVSMPFFHLSFKQILETMDNGLQLSSIGFLKFNQLIQSVGFFVIPGIILSFLFKTGKKPYFSYDFNFSLNIALFVLITIFLSTPFINFLLELNLRLKLPEWLSGVEDLMQSMETKSQMLMDKMLVTKNVLGLIFNILLIAVIPAMGEEFIFRGIFQQLFREWFRNAHTAIIVTAIIFSAVHFQFYGFLPRMALGIYFGYLFVWYRSIWVPVLAHFFNNAFAVIMYYLYEQSKIETNPDDIGSTLSHDWYYLLPSIVLLFTFIGLSYYFRPEKKIQNQV